MGKCYKCKQTRTLADGLCHECEQAERDAEREYLEHVENCDLPRESCPICSKS